MRCLRSICGIDWRDRITNVEVLDRCRMMKIESIVRLCRLRWLGHLGRMENGRLPKQLMFGRLKEESSVGKQKKMWTHCVHDDIDRFNYLVRVERLKRNNRRVNRIVNKEY